MEYTLELEPSKYSLNPPPICFVKGSDEEAMRFVSRMVSGSNKKFFSLADFRKAGFRALLREGEIVYPLYTVHASQTAG